MLTEGQAGVKGKLLNMEIFGGFICRKEGPGGGRDGDQRQEDGEVNRTEF